ncbi:DUF4418 family protein [Treponema phagedenis]|uniref:DUF4418 family protein n=1 Tax=Treponema phagedenis TaxID=162 RepID=UPI0001F641A7|nr:DUF4418 family protein [Treponema phagedenis]EFW39446.1 hypothetical protein HMPREF9554_00028 [Treponema phagedenis F0421]TYT79663.1 DUF4418 family protein [Treponema phagedenis]
MNKQYIFGVLCMLSGALLFFTPFGIAPVCGPLENGMFMKCHWMGEAVRASGGLCALLGVLFCFVKGAQKGIAIANIGIGIYAILLAAVFIGGCKMPAMACNAHTKPVIYLIAGIFIVLNLLYLFLSKKDQ